MLSRSLGLANRHCRQTWKLPEFSGAAATETYLLNFNEIFDLQNSSELTCIPSKGPVSPEYFSRMQELCDYIKNLTDKSGKPIISGARKTGFLGLMMNLQSFIGIHHTYVEEGQLDYLLARKCSQDQLEHFFGSV